MLPIIVRDSIIRNFLYSPTINFDIAIQIPRIYLSQIVNTTCKTRIKACMQFLTNADI
jgi:hypothetical protein